MAVINNSSFKAPFTEAMVDARGLLSRAWQQFFRKISDCLKFIGDEQFFDLVNNQVGAANITPLKFDKQYTSQAIIDYVVQRTTSTTELIQSGTKHAVYKPRANTWSLLEYGTSGPDASGITFSITSTGQIQYTSTNLGGTPSLSRIVMRIREIAGKSDLYSKVG